jgi:hypothetical protein
MSQQLQWVTPDGLTTITFSRDALDYKLLREYDGFSKMSTTHQTFVSPYLDGSTPVNTKIEERHISFAIMINAVDLPTLEAQILALTQALNPKSGSGTLVYTQEGGAVYAITCRADNTPNLSTSVRGPTWQKATIDLIAFSPYWFDPVPVEENLAAFTGGMTSPITFPMTFGTATQQATVTNTGDVAAPCTITIHGAITNPRLDNLTTGEYISATLTIAEGESLAIKTGPGAPTVRYLHGTSDDNGFQYLSDASTVTLLMEAGDNVLDFSASTSVGATAYCEVSFYPQFSGV